MTRLAIRGRRSRVANERDTGTTLVELSVTVLLIGVIGAMIMTTFIQGSSAVLNADARGVDSQQAKTATENMSKVLRVAADPDGEGAMTTFVTATPSEVVFYANLGNRTGGADTPPRRVRIWLDWTGVIRQTVIQQLVSGTKTTWQGAVVTRILAQGVVSTGRPLLTYLAADDNVPNATTGVTDTSVPNTNGTVTTTANLGAIRAVEVWVSVRSSPDRRSAATTAVTRVTLLNRS